MPKTSNRSIKATEAKAITPAQKPPSNLSSQTRILLALWTLEEATKSELKASLVRKRETETVAVYEKRQAECLKLIAQLDKENAFVTQHNKISLSETGLELLDQGLSTSEFVFEAQIGAKTANALLRWIRQRGDRSVVTANGKAIGKTIASYDEFKMIALEVFDRLNRDFNMDNLVPIYRIRREIGDRVSRSQFDEWLLEMQANDIWQLLEGTVEDSAPDKIEDSVVTRVSGLRCYATRLAV